MVRSNKSSRADNGYVRPIPGAASQQSETVIGVNHGKPAQAGVATTVDADSIACDLPRPEPQEQIPTHIEKARKPPDLPNKQGSLVGDVGGYSQQSGPQDAKRTLNEVAPCPPALRGKTLKSLKQMLQLAELLRTWPTDKASSFEFTDELFQQSGIELNRRQVANYFSYLDHLCGTLAVHSKVGMAKSFLPEAKDRLAKGISDIRRWIDQLEAQKLENSPNPHFYLGMHSRHFAR